MPMDDLMEYKCPNCGGAIHFEATTQMMKCPYCDSEFTMESLKQYDEILKKQPVETYEWNPYTVDSGNGDWTDEEASNMALYVCESCGGEIVGDRNMAATSCPYCNNPVVVTKQFSGTLRPDYVIPFFTTREKVTEALQEHLKGKPLLPSAFRAKHKVENIKGIYVPFWLFDANTAADIDFRTTRIHTWSDSQYNYTRTEHYAVHRAGSLGFERVPVDGSSKMPDDYMESIEPFDYGQMVDFQTAYLAGFLADKYDEDAAQSVPRANARIKNSTLDAFRDTVTGYATCTVQNANIEVNQGNIRYALLPVWMMNTRYEDKDYLFAMNGQTGKFVGELPVSKAKYWAWLSGLTVGIGAVLTLLSWLLF